MANPEQLALLKRGVLVWNVWRRTYPIIRPDFSGAYLSGSHLSGADLSGADLRGVDLNGADLRGVDLSGADLSGADLSGAHLSRLYHGGGIWGASLSGTHPSRPFSKANLSGTKLSRANLRGANLNGVYVSKLTSFANADLRGAIFSESDLKDADLTGAKRGPLPSKDVPDESHTNQTSFSPTDWVNFVGTYGNTLLTFVASVASVIQGLDVVERRWREHKEKQPSSGQKPSIHKVLDSEITHIQLVMDNGSLHSFEKWVSDPDTLKEYIDAFNDPASKVKPLEVIFKKHKGRSLSVNVTEGGKDNLQLNVILGYINSDPQK